MTPKTNDASVCPTCLKPRNIGGRLEYLANQMAKQCANQQGVPVDTALGWVERLRKIAKEVGQ